MIWDFIGHFRDHVDSIKDGSDKGQKFDESMCDGVKTSFFSVFLSYMDRPSSNPQSL